jgi:antitoxin ParD1/3/4/toxin ParE1/3/4
MTVYQLAPTAIADLEEILLNRSEHSGPEAAAQLEENLLSAFERLAFTPGLGHRRSDLTRKPYFFYLVDPYLIVYARHVDPLPILAILHAARNVRAVLARRKQ